MDQATTHPIGSLHHPSDLNRFEEQPRRNEEYSTKQEDAQDFGPPPAKRIRIDQPTMTGPSGHEMTSIIQDFLDEPMDTSTEDQEIQQLNTSIDRLYTQFLSIQHQIQHEQHHLLYEYLMRRHGLRRYIHDDKYPTNVITINPYLSPLKRRQVKEAYFGDLLRLSKFLLPLQPFIISEDLVAQRRELPEFTQELRHAFRMDDIRNKLLGFFLHTEHEKFRHLYTLLMDRFGLFLSERDNMPLDTEFKGDKDKIPRAHQHIIREAFLEELLELNTFIPPPKVIYEIERRLETNSSLRS